VDEDLERRRAHGKLLRLLARPVPPGGASGLAMCVEPGVGKKRRVFLPVSKPALPVAKF